jgi:Uma2 family endonuclease
MAGQIVEVEPGIPLFRISVARYHAMRDAGILDEDDRVELLDGLIVPKMTKHPPHRLCTRLERGVLEANVPAGYYVDSQEPITTDDSEPEPDVCVVRGAPRDYQDRHPGPADVPLVVEVADESLRRDRGIKLALYARARIAEHWIVDLEARTVEVYTEPAGDGFARRVDHADAGDLPLAIDGRPLGRIPVKSLLP